MKREVTVNVRWRLRVNEANTWRERLGMALRKLAWRVDGRPALGLAMSTHPVLTVEQRAEVLRFGFDQMGLALHRMAQIAAVDEVMREALPSLFEERV